MAVTGMWLGSRRDTVRDLTWDQSSLHVPHAGWTNWHINCGHTGGNCCVALSALICGKTCAS